MATEVTVIVDPDNGAGTDYTSLAAAIAGEARNLVTADEQLTIKCRCTGGTADGPATINGFTTDATRYVKIWTDPSESYRHAGTYPSGNKYRIEHTGDGYGITTVSTYIEIEGIAFKSTGTANNYFGAVRVGGAPAHIRKCYCKALKTAGYGYARIIYRTSGAITVSNIVIVGDSGIAQYGRGINSDGAEDSYVYNCTVSGGLQYGMSRGNGNFYAYNCAVFNCTDDFRGTFTTIDHCASDDGDGTNAVDISPGAIEADDWAACFTDYANGDFSLKSGSVCIGAGVDDPGSGLYSDDILGNTRTSPWDIGAFEYVSAAPSGITGTLAATLADSTSSSAGAVAIAGASAQTLANSTTSSAGAVAITGASAPTLANATLSAAGAVVSGITGSFAQTLADSTLSGTGTVAIAAALAQALADAATSASGAVLASGALGTILASASVASTGTVAVSGSLASTLADATVNASSSASAIGALSATLSDASLGASGRVAVSGSMSATLADATLSAPRPNYPRISATVTLASALPPPPYQEPLYANEEAMKAGEMTWPWVQYFQALSALQKAIEASLFSVVSGEFKNNTPTAGSVSWSRAWVAFLGRRHKIADGVTAHKYIYWSSAFPRAFQTSNYLPPLSETVHLVGVVVDGVFMYADSEAKARVYQAIESGGTIAPGMVEEASLADLAVTQAKLADLAVTLEKLAAGSVDITKCASSISPPEIFDVLPAPGRKGRIVFLTTDNKLYRDTGTGWTAAVETVDLSGLVTGSQIANGSIDITKCASSIRPPEIFDVLPAPGNKGRIVFLTSDNKLYRDTGTGWTVEVSTVDLVGTITSDQISDGAVGIAKFAAGISAPEILNSLPAPGNKGRLVFLTTDNKLYRDTGTAWTVEVSTLDLVGTISSAQIADGSIGLTKFASGIKPPRVLSAFPVSPENGDMVYLTVAAGDNYPANVLYSWNGSTWVTSARATDIIGSLVAGQIAAGAIGVDQLAANAVTAAKLASNSVTADKIEANAVTSAKIAANAISSGHISADSIIAGKIAAGAVSTSELAAKAVTTSKLAIIPDNICPDPYLTSDFWQNPHLWTRVSYASGNAADTLGVGSCVHLVNPGTARGHVWSVKRPLSGRGQVLRLRAKCNNTSNQVCNVVARMTRNDGTTTDITLGFAAGSGINSLSQQGTIPNNISAVEFIVYNYGGTTMTGEIAVSEVKLDVAASSELIVDGAVTAPKIAASAVETDKLAANAVTSGKIAANSITSSHILANSIISGKIAAGAVGANEIAAKAITVNKLAVLPYNHNPDPLFLDESAWSLMGAWQIVVRGTGNVPDLMQLPRALVLDSSVWSGTANVSYAGPRIDAAGVEQTLRLCASLYNNSNWGVRVGLYYYSQGGGYLGESSLTLDANSGLEWMSRLCTVPANTASIRISGYALADGTAFSGQVAVSNIRVDLAASADLIVDGSITATKIAADAITSDKILANAVSGDKIAANSISSGHIIANAITAGKIAAGAVGTTELAARAATINKLAVVPNNICPDPGFQDESAWNMSAGWTFLASDGSNLAHQMDVPKCAVLVDSPLQYSYHGYTLPSFSGVGQTLRLRYSAYNNSNQTMYAGISFKDRSNQDLGLIYDTLAPGSGFKVVSKQGAVPAGTVKLAFWARNDGLGMSGTMAIGGWKLDVAASADLIVDGSILTQHIGAGQVTANRISVSNLSSLSANIGTVTAGIITGTTIRTTADGSGNYMEISGTSLKGKDSGNNIIWEMFPAQGPLALTDFNDANYEKAINTTNLVNLGAYGGYDDVTGNPNTPEGAAQAMSDAMDWYASTGFTGKWNVTSLLPTAPRYVLVAIKATVSAGSKAEIIAGPVSVSPEWTAPPYRWYVYFVQAASAVRVGIIGQIMDTRLVIVPVQKIGSSLFIHLSYSGSLTGVTGTVRIVGIFS